MNKKYDFDYLIIGSGPAGRTAALRLAKAKKRVGLVEGNLFGGSELNTRDLPSTINLNFAHAYAKLHDYPALAGQDFHYNFPSLVSHTEHVTAELREQGTAALQAAGATLISGYAHFIDERTITVGTTQYTAASFILATGSQPKTREISGLDTVNYLTPDTAFKIRRLPRYVFVIGGGPTGVQIATYFAELGTKVIIMERSHRLLPREDKEVSATLTEYFENDLGIMVIPNAKVVAIEQDQISKRVIFNSAGQEKLVRIDCIVLATGSAPVTDYGLENASVKYRNSGIITDKSFQTSARHIYAIGDATIGTNQSSTTARAEYEANLLVDNLLHKTKSTANYAGFTRLINSTPQVATVGLNEYDLLSSDHRYKKSIVYFKEFPTLAALGYQSGFVKLLVDTNAKLLGASVVAPHADLLISELALAVRHRQSVTALAHLPHSPYTPAIAIAQAAAKLLK